MFRGGPDGPEAIRYEYEKALLSRCPFEQLSLVYKENVYGMCPQNIKFINLIKKIFRK